MAKQVLRFSDFQYFDCNFNNLIITSFLFLNSKIGYVLKPKHLLDEKYKPEKGLLKIRVDNILNHLFLNFII